MGLRNKQRLNQRETPLQEDLRLGLTEARESEERIDLLGALPPSEFEIPKSQSLDISNKDALLQASVNPERIEVPRPPRQEFRKTVGAEVGRAESAFQEAQREIGAFDEAQAKRFAQRGLTIGGRIVAQKELGDSIQAQERAIGELVQTSGIRDANQKAKFAADLNKKMDEARIKLLEFSQKISREITERKADEAKKRAMREAVFKLGGAIVGGMIGNPGGGAGAGSAIAGSGDFQATPTGTLDSSQGGGASFAHQDQSAGLAPDEQRTGSQIATSSQPTGRSDF